MAEPKRPFKNYLRPNQTAELESTVSGLESQLSDPQSARHIQNPGRMRQQRLKMQRHLEENAPPVLRGPALDVVAKREKELRAKITHGMNSQEEQRKNPPGAVDRHMNWERHFKRDILQWKNDRLTLGVAAGGNTDKDLANLELYRPKVSTLNMDNAQIPGKNIDIPSPLFMQNFDEIDWGQHGAVAQDIQPGEVGQELQPGSSRREVELELQLAKQVAEVERLKAKAQKPRGPKSKKVRSEAQLAADLLMKERNAEKRAAKVAAPQQEQAPDAAATG